MNKIEQIKKLTTELLQYCHEYYNLDCPSISDTEYDRKFDTLKQMEDEANFWMSNSPTRKVQGDVLPYLKKVRHSVPMLSADKSTDIEDVVKFIGNQTVTASFKLDGSTVVLKYQNGQLIQGLSRGSGIDGEDITHTVRMIKNLPATIPYNGYLEIRGEAVIPWRHYNEMNIDGSLGHPRNVASGALRQLDANEAAKRNIYFYAFTLVNWKEVLPTLNWATDDVVWSKYETLAFLKRNGFDIVPNVTFNDTEDGYLLKHETFQHLNRETYELPTDGWCFEYDDLIYGESLGSTSHHDRRLYALKPARTDYTTHFRGIEYKTCRTGVVSLTAVFDPVEIDNTIVTRATLHNVDYFNNLELGEDDEISVAKMNEIIPAVLDNNTRSNTYKLIDKCPSCGTELIVKNTGTANVLYCPNESCPSRSLAKFTHFVSKNCADIRGLSEKTLEALISRGFLHSFKDIYHLWEHHNELVQIEGLGSKSVTTLLKSIEKSREIKLENFITALGIPNVGLSAAKTISKYFNGNEEDFMIAYENDFDWTTLDDFGSVMANSLNEYLTENYYDVIELTGEFEFIVEEKAVVTENPFNGKSVAVTGRLIHFTRDSINAKLESLGAKPASGVTAKTHYLINNDPTSSSSKNKKANELNIPIITENQFLEMCGE